MRNKEMSSTEVRLSELQNEYQEIILGMKKDGTPTLRKGERYSERFIYNWTRLKELQIMIHQNINRVVEEGMKNAKRSLEEAFTPELKSMLSKKLQDEIEDDEE